MSMPENFFLFLMLTGSRLLAQEMETKEVYGRTLNLGTGVVYYPYIGKPVQVNTFCFEIQIDRNISVSPFFSVYAYQNSYGWSDGRSTLRMYNYQETVIPIGLKITYYFDELVQAGSKWDFYSSGSFGFVYRKTNWEKAYAGNKHISPGMGPLHIEFHAGAEYHLNKTLGIQLDVSTGASTGGLAIHLP